MLNVLINALEIQWFSPRPVASNAPAQPHSPSDQIMEVITITININLNNQLTTCMDIMDIMVSKDIKVIHINMDMLLIINIIIMDTVNHPIQPQIFPLKIKTYMGITVKTNLDHCQKVILSFKLNMGFQVTNHISFTAIWMLSQSAIF